MGDGLPRSAGMLVYALYPQDPRVHREATALQRRGVHVTVVSLRGEGQPERETVEGVRVVRVPLRAVRGGRLRYLYQYLLFFLLGAVALWRLPRPDVVHVHSLPDFLVLAALPARLRGAALVLDLHEAMPEIVAARLRVSSSAPSARAAAALERLSCLVADRVITVNVRVREVLLGRGIPAAKVSVVYNVPRGGRVDAPAEDRLVYAGGVNPERDLPTFLHAFASVARERPLALTVYGARDAERATLRELATALGVADRIEFLDRIPAEAVVAAIARGRAGVVTYEKNPLTDLAVPTKAFETALAGRPLVIADLPTVRRLFEGAALFYRPGDAADLAAQIRRALAGGEAVESLVQRAYEVAEAHSWERQEAVLVQAYREAVRA